MRFEEEIVKKTITRLLNGEDYRSEIINAINAQFFDFTIAFFKDIINAKLDNKLLSIDWYNKYFLDNEKFAIDDIAIYSGINKKTIHNIYGKATKNVIIEVAQNNYNYLRQLLIDLEEDYKNELSIEIKLVRNSVSVDLSLSESLLVLNALATKKIAIRGGAWSSIGKKVEKPLMLELCSLCNVKYSNYDLTVFVKDKHKGYDREVDFVLYDINRNKLRCEVKLMGKGNPESADVVIARDTNIFIADTLSEQNKQQFNDLGIKWIELKGNTKKNILDQFKQILINLEVPFN